MTKSMEENKVIAFDGCPYEYVLTGELGRGGSSVVYDGYYVNNSGVRRPVRIREVQYETEEERRNLRCVFDLNNSLFDTDGLTNRIVNTYEIYEKENKIYIVTTYQDGATLDKCCFGSVREVIGVVSSLARTLKLIHDSGYLYLDVKPENVLVLNGTMDWVQLYDFDSVIRKDDLEDVITAETDGDRKAILRFTSIWAAYELRCGDMAHISTWTDVYGVGAVLFYMLYGRAPGVFDCDEDAVYDIEKITGISASDPSFPVDTPKHFYRDSFVVELNEFFRKTLARRWSDRYQSMDELMTVLDSLYVNSDETGIYAVSSPVACPENVVGREGELELLADWFADKTKPCIFVTGMGGIGKSTLVRRFVMDVYGQLDAVIYISYKDSFISMVCDDDAFRINTVHRQQDENMKDYFHRKLSNFREYISESKKEVLVIVDNVPGVENRILPEDNIDNFHKRKHMQPEDITLDDGISELLNTGCRLVIVTRSEIVPDCYAHIQVTALADRHYMYELMQANMRTLKPVVNADLYAGLDKLIDCVNGHTLMLMLLARQIDRGYISVDEACSLVTEYGFVAMDGIETRCTIDSRDVYGRMTDIISELFNMNNLTNMQRGILMSLALFGDKGVYFRDFVQLISGDGGNSVNELADLGWIERRKKLALHPVIGQAVCKELGRAWKYMQENRNIPEGDMVAENAGGIKQVESCLNNLIHDIDKISRMNSLGPVQDRYRSVQTDEDNNLVSVCMSVADCCMNVDNLCDSEKYLKLAAKIIARLPIENERFILVHGRKILDVARRAEKTVPDADMAEVFDKLAHVYTDSGQYSETEEILNYLEQWSERKDSYIKGFVCDVWMDYLDTILDGDFEPGTKEKRKLYDLQMRYMDRAIRYYSETNNSCGQLKLVAVMIAKATYIIRSCEDGKSTFGSRRKVVNLLNRAKQIMDTIDASDADSAVENSENWLAYYIGKGWFYTYIEVDPCRADSNIHKAWSVYSGACNSELDLINYMLIPAANIYIELGDRDECIIWLKRALNICDRHEDLAVFNRKRKDIKKIIQKI